MSRPHTSRPSGRPFRPSLHRGGGPTPSPQPRRRSRADASGREPTAQIKETAMTEPSSRDLATPPAVADPSSTDPAADAGTRDELVRLRAERDSLAAQLDRRGQQHALARLFRQGLAALLVL